LREPSIHPSIEVFRGVRAAFTQTERFPIRENAHENGRTRNRKKKKESELKKKITPEKRTHNTPPKGEGVFFSLGRDPKEKKGGGTYKKEKRNTRGCTRKKYRIKKKKKRRRERERKITP